MLRAKARRRGGLACYPLKQPGLGFSINLYLKFSLLVVGAPREKTLGAGPNRSVAGGFPKVSSQAGATTDVGKTRVCNRTSTMEGTSGILAMRLPLK